MRETERVSWCCTLETPYWDFFGVRFTGMHLFGLILLWLVDGGRLGWLEIGMLLISLDLLVWMDCDDGESTIHLGAAICESDSLERASCR